MNKEKYVARNHMISMDGIAPCDHEEADTCIFVHARHVVEEGSKVLMVKASDTDILVIALSVLPHLQQIGLLQLWVGFGQGCNLRWFPIHDLYLSIGPEKSKGMPFFMLSLVVMLCQASAARGRSLHGKHGTCLMKLLMSLPS